MRAKMTIFQARMYESDSTHWEGGTLAKENAVRMCVCVCMCVYIYMCVVYMCVYVFIYIYIYIYIYI